MKRMNGETSDVIRGKLQRQLRTLIDTTLALEKEISVVLCDQATNKGTENTRREATQEPRS